MFILCFFLSVFVIIFNTELNVQVSWKLDTCYCNKYCNSKVMWNQFLLLLRNPERSRWRHQHLQAWWGWGNWQRNVLCRSYISHHLFDSGSPTRVSGLPIPPVKRVLNTHCTSVITMFYHLWKVNLYSTWNLSSMRVLKRKVTFPY